MTGLRTRAVRTIGRTSVGVLAVVLFMAPSAVATPESDAADTAITAAWDSAGGTGGALGDKDGDVYQVGEGFAQNFATGKIYFTPRTGAHFVQGAVLEKYQSVGGPADSDLGFPTADQAAGKAEGSKDSTFSAADVPVIFWTPENGAWVVRGAINAAWDKLGGSAGTLGVPTADETWKGSVVSQAFTGGEISWDAKSKTFTTTPTDLAGQLTGLNVPGDATTAIDAARRAAGGPLGPLGAEEGAQYKVGDKGLGQNYAGGTIYYSPNTGANAVSGQILGKYRGAGGPQGDLGFPTSSEADGGLPSSRIVTFAGADQPVIFWTPDHGAVIVRGAMNAAWTKLGGAAGKLGAPTGDQSVNGNVVSQKFTGGSVSWNSSTRAFTVDPSDLTGQLAGVQVPGQDLTKAAPNADSGKWYQFHWWWLLAIIPLVLAVGAIAIAAVLRRRRHAENAQPGSDDRGSHDDFADHDEPHGQFEGHDGYDDFHDEHHEGEYPGDHFDDQHFDEHYGDEHYGDESDHGAAGHFVEDHGVEEPLGHEQFQEDPDAIDTAPHAIANYDIAPPAHIGLPEQSAPIEQVASPEHHGPGGWAGLGVGLAAAGLGASSIAAVQHEPDEEPDEVPTPSADAEQPGVNEPESDESEVETDEPEPSEEAEPMAGPPSGKHHAVHLDEPETAQMSFRVAVGDVRYPPPGYAIKADTKTGQYWAPGTPGYESAPVEIWFASEEFAITNGFISG